jgi:hypothetical protein
MGLVKKKTKSSIPTSNHPFMTWLANFLAQINPALNGGLCAIQAITIS